MIAPENVHAARNRLAKALLRSEQLRAASEKQFDEILNLLMRDIDAVVAQLDTLIAPVDAAAPTIWHTSVIVARVIHKAALLYDIPADVITGQSRHKPQTRARHLAIYAARTLSPATLVEIGRYFGGRDHATVLHAIKRVASDPLLRAEAQYLANEVGAGLRKG